MYSYLIPLLRELLPVVLFVASIIFSSILAIITGGPIGRIVACGAASIVLFVLPLVALCRYVERLKKDNDKAVPDPEAARNAQKVASPVVQRQAWPNCSCSDCVALRFLHQFQVERRQRTRPHLKMVVDPRSRSVTMVAAE
jgi:hypothetical protein